MIPNLLQTTAAVQELQVLYRQSVNKTYSQSEQFIAFCVFFPTYSRVYFLWIHFSKRKISFFIRVQRVALGKVILPGQLMEKSNIFWQYKKAQHDKEMRQIRSY